MDKPMRWAVEAVKTIAVTRGCALDIQQAAEPLLAVVRAVDLYQLAQEVYMEGHGPATAVGKAERRMFQALPAALKAMEVSHA